jgi:hypothetical protein
VILEESGERAVGRLVRTSHVTIKGEHQLMPGWSRRKAKFRGGDQDLGGACAIRREGRLIT